MGIIEHELGSAAVSSLSTHLKKWVTNLGRAKQARQQQSRACLEKVILAVRETAVYCRALDHGQPVNYDKEALIAQRWTSLAMELDQLGLTKLAKKCRVKGWYWEDQMRFDEEFLNQAQVSFAQIERLASQLLKQLND